MRSQLQQFLCHSTQTKWLRHSFLVNHENQAQNFEVYFCVVEMTLELLEFQLIFVKKFDCYF